MPIQKDVKALNGIGVGYHKIVKLEADFRSSSTMVYVASYSDEQAYLDSLPVAWMWNLGVPASALESEGVLVDKLEIALIQTDGSPFKDGNLTSDKSLSIETLKVRKNLEINQARLKANRTFFTFNDKHIACDELSQLDIGSTNGEVSLTQEMPENWPGAWKAIDNSYVAIPDVATWTLFYKAMVQQGTLNFAHAQELKAAVAAATTPEDVDVIKW